MPITPMSNKRVNQSYAVGEFVPDENGQFNARKVYQLLKTQTQMGKYHRNDGLSYTKDSLNKLTYPTIDRQNSTYLNYPLNSSNPN